MIHETVERLEEFVSDLRHTDPFKLFLGGAAILAAIGTVWGIDRYNRVPLVVGEICPKDKPEIENGRAIAQQALARTGLWLPHSSPDKERRFRIETASCSARSFTDAMKIIRIRGGRAERPAKELIGDAAMARAQQRDI